MGPKNKHHLVEPTDIDSGWLNLFAILNSFFQFFVFGIFSARWASPVSSTVFISMRCSLWCAAMVSTWSGAAGVPDGPLSLNYDLAFLDDYPLAICNDGSPAAYYFHRGTDPTRYGTCLVHAISMPSQCRLRFDPPHCTRTSVAPPRLPFYLKGRGHGCC